MADAADENGEEEVAECLRFLWRHRLVPDFVGSQYLWADIGEWAESYWRRMPPKSGKDSATYAVHRILEAWPLHKHLLIDALEKETVT